MFKLLFITATALTGLVSAQNTTTTTTGDESLAGQFYSTSGPLEIDPANVEPSLRQSWCTGQRNNCPLICAGPDANPGDAFPNSCDDTTLDFQCVCNNGNQPNISAYMETIPFYVCSRWRDTCTANNANDLTAQTACQSVTCGTRNASAGASSDTDSSSSASPSASSTPSSTSGSSSGGSSSEDSPSSSSSAAAAENSDSAAIAVGVQYGTGILMAGMLALFGLAL